MAAFVLAFVVQLVVVVRHYTKLEGSIQMVSKDIENHQDNFSKDLERVRDDVQRAVERVERVERKLDESKVVMLRPHHVGPR